MISSNWYPYETKTQKYTQLMYYKNGVKLEKSIVFATNRSIFLFYYPRWCSIGLIFFFSPSDSESREGLSGGRLESRGVIKPSWELDSRLEFKAPLPPYNRGRIEGKEAIQLPCGKLIGFNQRPIGRVNATELSMNLIDFRQTLLTLGEKNKKKKINLRKCKNKTKFRNEKSGKIFRGNKKKGWNNPGVV